MKQNNSELPNTRSAGETPAAPEDKPITAFNKSKSIVKKQRKNEAARLAEQAGASSEHFGEIAEKKETVYINNQDGSIMREPVVAAPLSEPETEPGTIATAFIEAEPEQAEDAAEAVAYIQAKPAAETKAEPTELETAAELELQTAVAVAERESGEAPQAEATQQADEADSDEIRLSPLVVATDTPEQPEFNREVTKPAAKLQLPLGARIRLGFSRHFARACAFVILSALLLAPILGVRAAGRNMGYVFEEGERVATLLLEPGDLRAALVTQGIDLRAEDELDFEQVGETTMHISVLRASEVQVTADGGTQAFYIQNGTVADVLAGLGIEIGENDKVEPALDTPVTEDCTVTIQRVRYEYETLTEVVAYETVLKPSPLLSDEREVFCTDGVDGLAENTYRTTYIDGEQTERSLYEQDMITWPVNAVTVLGDGEAVASHLNGEDFTDIQIVDGVPESYEWVLEDAVCTAYSFKPGVFGASGMRLVQGFVAVDPSVIPYGSLLYIASETEGGFVYGWAIAADVGTAMVEGRVDIDCFFETYQESVLFGKKWLNVYVVGQLTQEQLDDYIGNAGMFHSRLPN